MVPMKLSNGTKTAHWTIKTDYCEIVAECREEGRIWEYVAMLHGLKSFMTSDLMFAIYGSFAVVGNAIEYRCHVGSDKEIKTWKIFQDSGAGEMWDDIRFLIDGHAEGLI